MQPSEPLFTEDFGEIAKADSADFSGLDECYCRLALWDPVMIYLLFYISGKASESEEDNGAESKADTLKDAVSWLDADGWREQNGVSCCGIRGGTNLF